MSLSSAALQAPAHGLSTTATPEFDPLELRRAFAQFPQGVVVVGAEVDGVPEGLVASTFTVGVSLEPALVTFAVQHTSSTWPRLRDAQTQLGVSVLGADQDGLCTQIASKDRPGRFRDVNYSVNDHGALTVGQVPLWLHTRIYNQFTAGDHDVVVLEVLDLGVREHAPGLVFHRSQFKALHGDS